MNDRRRTWGVWLSWLAAIWLLVVFICSIVYYSRGIDVVVVLIALIGQLVVTIAWTLWRPLPLWLVCGWGLVLLSATVGLFITVPNSFFLSWTLIGIVPVGAAMILAGVITMDRSSSLVH